MAPAATQNVEFQEVDLPQEFDEAQTVEDFAELAEKYFEPADEETLRFREECRKKNVSEVFCSGMSRAQVLEIIKSE